MIYLIQDCYKDDSGNYHDILKIGFTDNLERRKLQYRSNNFGFKLLKTRDGDENLEKLLHKYFNKFLLKESHNREWFEYDDEIIDNFDKLDEEFLSGFQSEKSEIISIEEYLSKLQKENVTLIGELELFLRDFNINQNFIRRMKLYCIFSDKNGNTYLLNSPIPNKFNLYYNELGSTRIKSLNYQESRIIQELDNKRKFNKVDINQLNISLGKKYTKKEIKEILQQFYNTFGISQTAKASDINQYYETKRAKIPTGITGKYDEGLELIKIKDNLL